MIATIDEDTLQSVPKRSRIESETCQNCKSTLPERKRRGSPRKFCSTRCRKLSWTASNAAKFDALSSVDALVESLEDFRAAKRLNDKLQMEQAAFTVMRRLHRLHSIQPEALVEIG